MNLSNHFLLGSSSALGIVGLSFALAACWILWRGALALQQPEQRAPAMLSLIGGLSILALGMTATLVLPSIEAFRAPVTGFVHATAWALAAGVGVVLYLLMEKFIPMGWRLGLYTFILASLAVAGIRIYTVNNYYDYPQLFKELSGELKAKGFDPKQCYVMGYNETEFLRSSVVCDKKDELFVVGHPAEVAGLIPVNSGCRTDLKKAYLIDYQFKAYQVDVHEYDWNAPTCSVSEEFRQGVAKGLGWFDPWFRTTLMHKYRALAEKKTSRKAAARAQ